MDRLKKLEIQKLVKEFDFLRTDIDLKKEIISEMDIKFQKQVDIFIENHPKLKFLLEEKKQYEIENQYTDENESDDIKGEQKLEDNKIKNTKLKSLYRQIARNTHPDVSSKYNLNEVYLIAKKAYEEDDIYSIIGLCENLNIPYDLNEEEITDIKNEIDQMKKRLKFLESTFTWQWYKKQDKSNNIILAYIKAQLIK